MHLTLDLTIAWSWRLGVGLVVAWFLWHYLGGMYEAWRDDPERRR